MTTGDQPPAIRPASEETYIELGQDNQDNYIDAGLGRLFDLELLAPGQTADERISEVLNNMGQPDLRHYVARMYGIVIQERLDERLEELVLHPEARAEFGRMTHDAAATGAEIYSRGFDQRTGLLRIEILWQKLFQRFERGDVRSSEKRSSDDGQECWPMLAVFADGDAFGLINKTYDHSVGNRAIHAIAQIFRGGFRVEDLTARYGGDEFVGVAFGLSAEEAAAVGARIAGRMQTGANIPVSGGETTLTATTAFKYDSDVRTFGDARALIEEANRQLLQIKGQDSPSAESAE